MFKEIFDDYFDKVNAINFNNKHNDIYFQANSIFLHRLDSILDDISSELSETFVRVYVHHSFEIQSALIKNTQIGILPNYWDITFHLVRFFDKHVLDSPSLEEHLNNRLSFNLDYSLHSEKKGLYSWGLDDKYIIISIYDDYNALQEKICEGIQTALNIKLEDLSDKHDIGSEQK